MVPPLVMDRRYSRVVAVEIIFLVVGVALMAGGIAIVVSEVHARRETKSMRGIVIGFSKGKSNSTAFSFHPVAEYVGPNGQKYFVEGSVGSSVPLQRVGAPVTILVRPREPEKAVLKSPLSFILGSSLALMGLISVAVFRITFRPSVFSLVAAVIVLGGLALKVRKAWRKEPITLQAWREYKKQTLSPRVCQSKDEIRWADPISISAAIENYRKSNRFAVPILFGLGFGLLLASYFAYSNTETFLESADRSSGQVIDLRQTDPGSDGSPTYAAVVEYIDRGGQRHTVVDSFSSDPPSYRKGDDVMILYNRNNPSDARIDRGVWNYWLSGICGSLGALFTLLGSWSSRRRFGVRHL